MKPHLVGIIKQPQSEISGSINLGGKMISFPTVNLGPKTRVGLMAGGVGVVGALISKGIGFSLLPGFLIGAAIPVVVIGAGIIAASKA